MRKQRRQPDRLPLSIRQLLGGTVTGVFLFSMIINLLALTGPLFMLQVYDRVLSSGSVETLIGLTVLMGGLYFFYGLIEIMRGRVMSRVAARLDVVQSGGIVARLMRPETTRDQSVGLRPVQDLGRIKQFVSSPGILAIFDLPWVPVYLLVVYAFHPLLGLVVLAAMGLLALLALLNEVLSRPVSQTAAQIDAARTGLVENARSGIEALTAMGMAPTMFARWRELNTKHDQSNRRGSDISGGFLTATKTFRMFLQSGILGLGAYLAIQGELSPGMMIAVSTIASRALAPVEQGMAHWRAFIGARQAWGRLRIFLRAELPAQPKVPLPPPHQTVKADAAAIGPKPGHTPVLSGVNFTAAPGDLIGVVGKAGSGKTALARGLVGVWPVLSGSIRLDGAELRQWTDAARGGFVGYVPQTIDLFDGTIAENIARFDPQTDDAEVLRAAKMVGAHDMIVRQPKGYDTPIAKAGNFLSGGQRQLIALARAVYRMPFLVVLDEPNSNLDNTGQTALLQAMRSLKKAGSITFVVTHTPALLAHVDKFLIVEDGKQSGFGAREDFMPTTPTPIRPSAPDKPLENRG